MHEPCPNCFASLLPSYLSCVLYPWREIPTPIAVAVTRPGSPGESRDTLIQVVIEFRSGTARFRVSVRAHSIRRAISLVRSSYPGAEASLVLPVDLESFFLGDDFDGTEQETFLMPERLLVG